jgi:hypothetical protein
MIHVVRHKDDWPLHSCMAEQVLVAHVRAAVRVRVVAPAKYARVWQVMQEQVAQPIGAVNAVTRRSRLLAVFVQAVYRNDAALV